MQVLRTLGKVVGGYFAIGVGGFGVPTYIVNQVNKNVLDNAIPTDPDAVFIGEEPEYKAMTHTVLWPLIGIVAMDCYNKNDKEGLAMVVCSNYIAYKGTYDRLIAQKRIIPSILFE